jgi:hypothetical protein
MNFGRGVQAWNRRDCETQRHGWRSGRQKGGDDGSADLLEMDDASTSLRLPWHARRYVCVLQRVPSLICSLLFFLHIQSRSAHPSPPRPTPVYSSSKPNLVFLYICHLQGRKIFRVWCTFHHKFLDILGWQTLGHPYSCDLFVKHWRDIGNLSLIMDDTLPSSTLSGLALRCKIIILFRKINFGNRNVNL